MKTNVSADVQVILDRQAVRALVLGYVNNTLHIPVNRIVDYGDAEQPDGYLLTLVPDEPQPELTWRQRVASFFDRKPS